MPNRRIVLWPDAAAFLRQADGFLLAEEARHNLTYGLALALRELPPEALATDPPFFATIEAGDRVEATALRSGHNLILSPAAAADFTGSPVLEELAEITQAETPQMPGVLAPPAVARDFAAAWSRQTGRPWRLTRRERIHALTAVRPLPLPPGDLRLATTADRALIVPWLAAMHAEIFTGEPFDAEEVADRRLAPPEAPEDPLRSLYLWIDEHDQPRSMAGAHGATPSGVRIGAVFTPPEFRRRGYATATVAALSQAMLDLGRRACYLYTDLANPTSNHIYAEIGYEPVADVDEIRFP